VSGDEAAAAYDAWYATPLGAAAHRLERRAVAALARPRPGERALDAGCGTGVYSAWLAGEGLEVTGLDRDPRMLAAARRKAPQAAFVQADVTGLPFETGRFDLALAVTVFCFLTDAEREAAASELLRTTRPGGRVVVGELARWSIWAAQRRVKGWRGSATWRAARFSTAGRLERIFLGAGADRVTRLHAVYLPPVDRAPVVDRAEEFERLGRRLGPVGAAFVAVRAERAPAQPAHA
jgi:ubiquinone/menaquinone biosynthesis C-methylase UbiE